MSLTPYSGSWDNRAAGHLLRRTTFGHTKSELQEALKLGLDGSIEKLFERLSPPEPPVNYADRVDAATPLGETWVESVFNREGSTRTARWRSLSAWLLMNIADRRMNIMSRMLMFWHNHFVVDFLTVREPRHLYTYWETLRRNALGNFQTFVEEITIDPAMLRYLDGRSNTGGSPNENYARELMELFTLGKGELAGPGDYTTYTEDDVLEMARILTGWVDLGYNSTTIGKVSSAFNRRRHDVGEKQLSHRFGNVVVSDGGEEEYKTLIDIIFQKEEVAYFIIRKLYRFFVSTHIDSTVESDIITPLAEQFITDGYELEGVLKTLLSSQHFFDQLEVQGGIITNPIENLFKIVLPIGSPESRLDYQERYSFWWRIFNQISQMQMAYFQAPDVAGWPSYYLEPQYSELWINSVTIRNRQSFLNAITSRRGFAANQERVRPDYLGFIDSLENPSDVHAIIEEMSELFFPKGLTADQKLFLRDSLLPGLPDFVWTNEYNDYKNNPGDPTKANVLINRLQTFFRLLFIIPEFQVQ